MHTRTHTHTHRDTQTHTVEKQTTDDREDISDYSKLPTVRADGLSRVPQCVCVCVCVCHCNCLPKAPSGDFKLNKSAYISVKEKQREGCKGRERGRRERERERGRKDAGRKKEREREREKRWGKKEREKRWGKERERGERGR